MKNKEILNKIDNDIELFKEKIKKKIREEFNKEYGITKRIIVKGIWATKKHREDKIIIEYLIEGIGNRQIEISFLDGVNLFKSIQRIVLQKQEKE